MCQVYMSNYQKQVHLQTDITQQFFCDKCLAKAVQLCKYSQIILHTKIQ